MQITIYECDRCGARTEKDDNSKFTVFSHEETYRPDGVETLSPKTEWVQTEVDFCHACLFYVVHGQLRSMTEKEQSAWFKRHAVRRSTYLEKKEKKA